MTATTNTTLLPAQLALKDVLQIYLLCFDAAVAALQPYPLAYAIRRHYAGIEVPVWELWSTDDDDPPEELLSLPSPPEEVVSGLMRKDMCDWFCFLLEEEVDKKVRGKPYSQRRFMFWYSSHSGVKVS